MINMNRDTTPLMKEKRTYNTRGEKKDLREEEIEERDERRGIRGQRRGEGRGRERERGRGREWKELDRNLYSLSLLLLYCKNLWILW